MNSKRLKQIEEVYHEAANAQPEERSSVVGKFCGDDEDLRLEIESLLSFNVETESFLDTSPDLLPPRSLPNKMIL